MEELRYSVTLLEAYSNFLAAKLSKKFLKRAKTGETYLCRWQCFAWYIAHRTWLSFNIDSVFLSEVTTFEYLGSILSINCPFNDEITKQISAANSQCTRAWNCQYLQIKTKITVYKAVVRAVILYRNYHGACTKHLYRFSDIFTKEVFTMLVSPVSSGRNMSPDLCCIGECWHLDYWD